MPARERFPHLKTNTPSKRTKKKTVVIKWLLPIVLLVVAVVVAGLYAPFSPLVNKRPPTGPKLTVGTNPYIYACSVFDAAKTAQTLRVNGDVTKENIQEEYAFDPANTTNKPVDLLALTGNSTATSTCRLKFDRVYVTGSDGKKSASFINVTASLVQFADTKTAREAYDNAKQAVASPSLKTMASVKDSYYAQPTPSIANGSPIYIRPTALYKNMLIRLSAPLASDDTDGAKMVAMLSTVIQDAQSSIAAGKGNKTQDYSGMTRVGQTPFTDACATIDYRKLATSIDHGISLNPVSTQAIQNVAPDDTSVPGVTQAASNCSFTFRTAADKSAQEKQKAPNPTTPAEKAKLFDDRYPHYFNARIAAVKDTDAAHAFIAAIKRQTQDSIKHSSAQYSSTKVSDVALGDSAIRITTTPQSNTSKTAGVYDSQVYYVAKGSYVYQFSTYFTRQSQPYHTTNYQLSDQDMKPILSVFTHATALASKK